MEKLTRHSPRRLPLLFFPPTSRVSLFRLLTCHISTFFHFSFGSPAPGAEREGLEINKYIYIFLFRLTVMKQASGVPPVPVVLPRARSSCSLQLPRSFGPSSLCGAALSVISEREREIVLRALCKSIPLMDMMRGCAGARVSN